jgi:hypothetical protein|tara:strand:+ start:829 stop:1590 length:762 start_codon:yes stop_codon:yes gene_type:complete
MRKVLIAGGDSWTDPNFRSSLHPEMNCDWATWPEVLAEKLDMDCINLGRCGAGNNQIYTSVLNELQKIDPSNIGLVSIGWSQAQRNENKVRGVWMHVDHITGIAPYGRSISHYGDITYRLEHSIMLYYSLQEICKSKNIPLLHVQMIPIFKGYSWSIANQNEEEIDGINDESLLRTMLNNLYIDKIDNNFIGWPTENLIGGFNIETDILRNRHIPEGNSYPYAVSNIDPHPNALGHTKIAEYLYETLATINLI